ncbi:MAG: glycosyltransferase family 4 protein [Terriglobales bacterium]
MKIALLMHELLIEGGGERQCLSLADALSRKGHDVTIFTCEYDPANCFPDVCKSLRIEQVGRWFQSLRRPRFVRGYLDMKRLASAVNTKHDIWNPHHWPAQWAAVWLKRKLGGSVLWMCNDVPTFPEKSQQRGSVKKSISAAVHRFYYWYDRKQNRKMDLTLLLSRWAESEFRAVYDGPTCVVRSGMDPVRFTSGGGREKIRSRFEFNEKDFVLLWLGIFMPHRRLEDAIEAVALLADRGVRVKLLLAGSPTSFPGYFDSLKALVSRLGIESQVIFAGKVADEEIRDFYCSCDAFLFPNDQQTWGLAVLEAMACGCPVLVSRGSGVHEVLTDNCDALLFPPRNPQTLSTKIEILVTQPALQKEIAANGIRLVQQSYNWDRFADQIEAIAAEFVDLKDSSGNINPVMVNNGRQTARVK